MLTRLLTTFHKWIAYISVQTITLCYVIDNATFGISTAWSRTWINAFLIYTTERRATLVVIHAFRSAIWWWSQESLVTRARWWIVDCLTYWIRTAWRWYTWVCWWFWSFLCWNTINSRFYFSQILRRRYNIYYTYELVNNEWKDLP